jgi:hypothetical protein
MPTGKQISTSVEDRGPPAAIPAIGINGTDKPRPPTAECAIRPRDRDALSDVLPLGAIAASSVVQDDGVILGFDGNIFGRFAVARPRPTEAAPWLQQLVAMQAADIDGFTALTSGAAPIRVPTHSIPLAGLSKSFGNSQEFLPNQLI